MEIVNLKDITAGQRDQLVEIFFDSSGIKSFESEEKREAFFFKYFGYYEKFGDYFFVSKEKNKVYGYICGVKDSLSQSLLYHELSHYRVFDDLYRDYPAHLHINLHKDSRGLGIGSQLIGTLEDWLSKEGVKGVHLITAPEAKNRAFYQKNGYINETETTFNSAELLFMGKLLKSIT